MSSARVVVSGLGWPEGPSVLPDGRVAFVEAYLGRISSFHPQRGLETLALVGGGPNATTLGKDGRLYVTQTGGIVGPWRSQDPCPPCIQSVTASGKVEVIATELGGVKFQAPNDLAFGPDGNLYFTDPGRFDLETKPDPGYLFVLRPDGSGDVLEELPPTYPNGIAVLDDNSVVWVESYTRRVRRRLPSGKVQMLHEFGDPNCIPDGFAVTREGNFVIATCGSGLCCVLSPTGKHIGQIAAGKVPTNCAFDGGLLYVTDGGHPGNTTVPVLCGCLWIVETEHHGVSLHDGAIATSSTRKSSR
jgi:gluconolactonase